MADNELEIIETLVRLENEFPAFGGAEKRSGLRRFGEDCLSAASSGAAGVREHHREPQGTRQGENGFGHFCRNKSDSSAGAKPCYKKFNLDATRLNE